MKLSQEQLSREIGFNDRQTLSDIENGKRTVKAEELLKFSDALDQDVEFFLDPFSVAGEAQYSWRASRDIPDAALEEFEARAAGWFGMLRWLRAQAEQAPSPLGFSLRLNVSSSFEAAQHAAEQLAERLGLGDVPALRLAECIEQQLDIPVLFVDMSVDAPQGSISGAACHLPEIGAVLVNRRESAARRNFDLAHELFHSLTWERMPPERRESNSPEQRVRTRRVEQLADNFAAALLMPRASLDVLIDSSRAKDLEHLVGVATQLQVSTSALAWRLRGLGRIDEPLRERLSQVRRNDGRVETPKRFSRPFVTLLHAALERGWLTARKASRALDMSLEEVASLFVEYDLTDPVRS